MRLALFALFALALSAAPSAQVSFSLGPTVNWTQDVSALTVDSDDPDSVISRDSISVPVTVGLAAGLGATVRAGDIGVRLGGRFLNTTLLYDGQEAFNEEALATNFVTLQIDLEYSKSLGPLRAYAFAGPEFRYLLDLSDGVRSASDVRDGLDLLSTAANLGAGLRVDLFGFRAGPEVRYALDLTGVGGDPTVRDDGTTVRLSEAFDVNTLLLGIVVGK